MRPRSLVAGALLALLLLPVAASAKKPKIYHYSATSSAAGVTTASFGSIGNIASVGPPGTYQLFLSDRDDVVGCVAVASPTAACIGFVATELSATFATISVTTFNHAGSLAPMAFSITVDCPKPPKVR